MFFLRRPVSSTKEQKNEKATRNRTAPGDLAAALAAALGKHGFDGAGNKTHPKSSVAASLRDVSSGDGDSDTEARRARRERLAKTYEVTLGEGCGFQTVRSGRSSASDSRSSRVALEGEHQSGAGTGVVQNKEKGDASEEGCAVKRRRRPQHSQQQAGQRRGQSSRELCRACSQTPRRGGQS